MRTGPMTTSSLHVFVSRIFALFTTTQYGCASAVILCLVAYKLTRRDSPPFPPGPKGLPLVGNAFDMPTQDEWKKYSEWAQKYGSIVSLNVLGQRLVILNSRDLCRDLLESSRSSSYMDRPRSTFLEMMGYASWLVGILPPNKQWSNCRKQLAFNLNPQAVQKWRSYHIFETHRLLSKLLDSPEKLFHHVDRAVAGDLLLTVYGHQIPTAGEDDFVNLQDQAVIDTGRALSRGAFMFDVLPTLRYIPEWIPGSFKRQNRKAYETGQRIFHEPLKNIQEQMAKGIASPSYISTLLEAGHDEFVIKQTSGTVYNAAIGGSKAVILGAILAAMEYPEVLRKAQQEIDSVTESTRLPEFKDRDSLPYIRAFVKEVFRWITPAPIGLPRLVTQDDIVQGYFIPAGSLVMTNTWHMLHDENIFPDALDFIPERHLDEKGSCPDPVPEGFGHGKRICPGRYLIDELSWISIVSLLATFNIKKPLDERGSEIRQEIKYTGGVVRGPLPFKVNIQPRSPELENIIRMANQSLRCFH